MGRLLQNQPLSVAEVIVERVELYSRESYDYSREGSDYSRERLDYLQEADL